MSDDHVDVVGSAMQEEAPASPLEQFAAKHRELVDTREVNIPIPGYDRNPPLLLVRYRLLEGTEISQMADKIKRETKSQWQRTMFAAIDTFIKASVGFYFDMGDGLYHPLMYQGEHVVRWDSDLAEALGFADELPENPTARQVAFCVFNSNDAAIAKHNYVLNAWFSDTSLDVLADLLGNL